MRLTQVLEEYAKHSALNFGQVLHGIEHLFSHPDMDEVAPRGTARHCILSLLLRCKRVANDLFFALIPPHWHHTADELQAMRPVSIKRWFFYGFAAWQFTEMGDIHDDLSSVDRRWDPRCKTPLGRNQLQHGTCAA